MPQTCGIKISENYQCAKMRRAHDAMWPWPRRRKWMGVNDYSLPSVKSGWSPMNPHYHQPRRFKNALAAEIANAEVFAKPRLNLPRHHPKKFQPHLNTSFPNRNACTHLPRGIPIQRQNRQRLIAFLIVPPLSNRRCSTPYRGHTPCPRCSPNRGHRPARRLRQQPRPCPHRHR